VCSGGALHFVAPRYKVSKWALSRHKRKCISAAVVKSAADREGASGANLIAVVQGLIAELEELKTSARRKRNGGPEVHVGTWCSTSRACGLGERQETLKGL
jgi:hypothetical protein